MATKLAISNDPDTGRVRQLTVTCSAINYSTQITLMKADGVTPNATLQAKSAQLMAPAAPGETAAVTTAKQVLFAGVEALLETFYVATSSVSTSNS